MGGREPIQQQRLNLVVPKKESRGCLSAFCLQEFSLFFEDASDLTKRYFVFTSKDKTKEAGCHPDPCSPYLNEAEMKNFSPEGFLIHFHMLFLIIYRSRNTH